MHPRAGAQGGRRRAGPDRAHAARPHGDLREALRQRSPTSGWSGPFPRPRRARGHVSDAAQGLRRLSRRCDGCWARPPPAPRPSAARPADPGALTEQLIAELDDTDGDQRSLIELTSTSPARRCTHNPFLEAALGEHYLLSLRIWFLALDRVETLGDAVREHRDLLEAIRDGDGDRAEAAMLRHISGFEQAIRVVL